jgi:HEAT repeat protein
MRHVFISYCREDAEFAQTVEEKINAAEFTTWRDVDVRAGGNWQSEIDVGVKDAMAVVVIMSPQSAQSVYVSYEWAYALGAGVPVIPLLLNLTYSELHPRLTTTQGLDFSGKRPWDVLLTSLKEIAAAERPFTVRVPRDAPPAVQQAARSLDSADAKERESAIQSLGQMNHPTAEDALVEALRHPTQQIRLQAAIQLIGFHDARSLPVLLESQQWAGNEVEPWRIAGIGESAVPGLVEALRHKDRSVRLCAVSALGAFQSSAAVHALTMSLDNPDLEFRGRAVNALEESGSSEAVPALRQALRGSVGEIRSSLARALGKCGGKTVVPDLIELAGDPDSGVRLQAVASLREIKDPTSVPALLKALTDSYEQVGANAAKGLEAIGDPQSIAGLIDALGKTDSNMVRSFVGDTIRSLGPAAVPGLREAVRHPNAAVRTLAIELLGAQGHESDLPALIEALRDQSASVRLHAVQALAERQGPQVVESLIPVLKDDDEGVARKVVSVLGGVRDNAAVEALVACLGDEDDQLAAAAAAELEKVNTRTARIALKAWKKQAGT